MVAGSVGRVKPPPARRRGSRG